MIASFRKTLTAFLAAPALASAQAPIVPLTDAGPSAPVRVAAQMPMPAPVVPMPMPGAGAPAPVTPVTPGTPAVTIPQVVPPASTATQGAEATEEPAKEPDRYLVEGLLSKTAAGKRALDNGYRVYGWTAFSHNLSTARSNNFPRILDDRANQFLLNQNYLVLEKTLDTSKKEFQLGGVANIILPGSDARYTVPRGLWDVQLRDNNGIARLYPIDPYQLYAQAFLPNVGPEGTTVKVGRFATHIGYEVVQAVDNPPFVSRAYMFQNNPFTHTGIWATTQLNDTWSMGHGVATGADTFIDPANRVTYLGQLKWAPKGGKTTVAFNTMVTDPTFDAKEAFAFYNYYGLLLTHQITDKLSYVLDSGYSHINGAPLPDGTTGFADWYGAANYLTYAFTDKLSNTVRAELFNDSQGFRTGTRGLYTAVSYGIQWKPLNWLYLRPSVRYDHNVNAPFEGQRNLWGGTMECIVRW